MARPLDTQRRAELAHRALEVLRARGIGRTTMSELAEALGVKRPTLYFYFRDLTGLLHAALEDVYRAYFAHVSARVAGIDHPIVALGELARATVEFQRGRRDVVALLFQLWAAGDADPEEMFAKARAVNEPLRADLIARVEAGIARGVVEPCDAAAIVDLVMTVLDGTIVQEVTRGASGAAVVEELWQRVLAPLVRAERRESRERRSKR
ncbi:MAG TPA: TetR/AcrR family transcriptional regulator [Kofleriaceae bacterium]|nr:TetR/AcrR family transcriptional regulator [Kofleriaceae bacterium]